MSKHVNIDLYNALNEQLTIMYGNDSDLKTEWLRAYDTRLNVVPAELLITEKGVKTVTKYLEILNRVEK